MNASLISVGWFMNSVNSGWLFEWPSYVRCCWKWLSYPSQNNRLFYTTLANHNFVEVKLSWWCLPMYVTVKVTGPWIELENQKLGSFKGINLKGILWDRQWSPPSIGVFLHKTKHSCYIEPSKGFQELKEPFNGSKCCLQNQMGFPVVSIDL